MDQVQQYTQSNELPTDGASNAADFQPETRNPQQPVNTQETGGLQTAGSQDVLSNTDARIIVPTGTGQSLETTTAPNQSQINWMLVFAFSIALAAWLFYLWRHRSKSSRTIKEIESIKAPTSSVEVMTVPAEPVEAETKSTEQKVIITENSSTSLKPKRKPSKSKSKRKKSKR